MLKTATLHALISSHTTIGSGVVSS